MAFRRRRFKRRFSGRRLRKSSYEISQGYSIFNFSVIPTSTLNTPDKFAIHLFSQYGLARTSADLATGTTSTIVVDASKRRLSVAWLQVRFHLQHVPQVSGSVPLTQINYIPVHISCYKDDLVSSSVTFTSNMSVIPTHFTAYNPFVTEVGSPIVALDPTFGNQRTGAAAEIFSMPDRIMHRDHWLQPVMFTDTAITDEAFWEMNANPWLKASRVFTVKKISLEDAAAIWFEIASAGTGIPSGTNANLPFAMEWIVCYRTVS